MSFIQFSLPIRLMKKDMEKRMTEMKVLEKRLEVNLFVVSNM